MEQLTLDLIRNAQNGDSISFAQLVETNKALVWSIVRRYFNRGYEADDLFQIGMIGFIKAVKNYNVELNVELSTYAVHSIIGEIRTFIRDDGNIKVSRKIKENSIKIKKAKEKFYSENEREPTISELSNILDIDGEQILLAIDATNDIQSIYAVVHGNDNNSLYLIDQITSKENVELEVVEKIAIKDIINSLDALEKKIIILKYFKGKTQTQIAKQLGLNQVKISRIERRILNYIREKNIV